jgi:hypothetical protein
MDISLLQFLDLVVFKTKSCGKVELRNLLPCFTIYNDVIAFTFF